MIGAEIDKGATVVKMVIEIKSGKKYLMVWYFGTSRTLEKKTGAENVKQLNIFCIKVLSANFVFSN